MKIGGFGIWASWAPPVRQGHASGASTRRRCLCMAVPTVAASERWAGMDGAEALWCVALPLAAAESRCMLMPRPAALTIDDADNKLSRRQEESGDFEDRHPNHFVLIDGAGAIFGLDAVVWRVESAYGPDVAAAHSGHRWAHRPCAIRHAGFCGPTTRQRPVSHVLCVMLSNVMRHCPRRPAPAA